MNKKAILTNGEVLEIIDSGQLLLVRSQSGEIKHRISPPEHSIFYILQEHYNEGPCPIVSFDPAHKVKERMDWFFRVDTDNGTIEILNPWV